MAKNVVVDERWYACYASASTLCRSFRPASRMFMRRFILDRLRGLVALLAAAVLASCADAPLLTPPPSVPLMSAVDVIESGEYTTITFDRDVPLPGWADVGQTYARYGLEFFSGSIQSPSGPGAFAYPWEWDSYQYYLKRFPPSSLPGFVEFGYGWPSYLTLYLSFAVPVSEVRLFVRPQADFEITCYNADDQEVGGVLVPGVNDANWHPRIRDFPSDAPYPGHDVRVTGPGIRYCDIIARGGMMDDLSFRREKQNDIVLECTAPGESSGGQAPVARATQSAPAAITIERGKEIDCTVKTEGPGGGGAQGEVQVARWMFEGVPRDDETPTAPTWDGVMVRGGTLSVLARAGSGPERTASVNVTIRDRTWDEAPVFHISEVPNGQYLELTLPAQILWAHHLGFTRIERRRAGDAQDPDPTGYVVSGPNMGISYLQDLSFTMHAQFVLNRAEMRQGSGFYAAQERATSRTIVGGLRFCPPRVVIGLATLVEAHEQKHISEFRRVFSEVVRASIPRLERLTGESSADLSDEYGAAYEAARERAFNASDAIHRLQGNPNRLTVFDGATQCALKNMQGTELDNESSTR